tara:strand:+ start:255 stop:467 length:213 start_codon:yes stop_codon:yes gene_type:complete
MIKFRVVQNSLTDKDCQETNTKIFAEGLIEQEAIYIRDNLIYAGEENVHIEEYEYISPEHRGLGRDPDLH